MATWGDITEQAPEFAGRVRARFDLGIHKTIATLREDGSPRISGVELEFTDDGEVTLGMMGGSVKLLDVRRDPRVALHSPTLDPPPDDGPETWAGDAKFAGTLVETAPTTNDSDAGHFRVDIIEVALTYVGTPANHLVIESWHPDKGWQRRTRE